MPYLWQKCGRNSNWSYVPDPITVDHDTPVASHRAAVAEIDNEIARFKAHFARYIFALMKQRTEVEVLLDAVVYPVLSLPTEIMARIFVACLPKDLNGDYVR
jgi:hypothetical protein